MEREKKKGAAEKQKSFFKTQICYVCLLNMWVKPLTLHLSLSLSQQSPTPQQDKTTQYELLTWSKQLEQYIFIFLTLEKLLFLLTHL